MDTSITTYSSVLVSPTTMIIRATTPPSDSLLKPQFSSSTRSRPLTASPIEDEPAPIPLILSLWDLLHLFPILWGWWRTTAINQSDEWTISYPIIWAPPPSHWRGSLHNSTCHGRKSNCRCLFPRPGNSTPCQLQPQNPASLQQPHPAEQKVWTTQNC